MAIMGPYEIYDPSQITPGLLGKVYGLL